MFKAVEPQPHVIRMHAMVASALAKRRQVAIASPAWPDWLTITALEFFGDDRTLLRAVQSGGAHTGSEVYFEANSLRGLRLF